MIPAQNDELLSSIREVSALLRRLKFHSLNMAEPTEERLLQEVDDRVSRSQFGKLFRVQACQLS